MARVVGGFVAEDVVGVAVGVFVKLGSWGGVSMYGSGRLGRGWGKDIRVSWTVGTADVSALGARLGGRVEERSAAVAVSPHALDGLLEDELLLRRPRWLGDLQAVLVGLLDDDIDGGLVTVNLLWELGALGGGGLAGCCCGGGLCCVF